MEEYLKKCDDEWLDLRRKSLLAVIHAINAPYSQDLETLISILPEVFYFTGSIVEYCASVFSGRDVEYVKSNMEAAVEQEDPFKRVALVWGVLHYLGATEESDVSPLYNECFKKHHEEELEALLQKRYDGMMEEKVVDTAENTELNDEKVVSTLDPTTPPFKPMRCFCCGRTGHKKRKCPHRRSVCRSCKKVGHTLNTCWKVIKKTCYCCGMKGHIKRNCPKKTARCHGCGKIGHLLRTCRQGLKYPDKPIKKNREKVMERYPQVGVTCGEIAKTVMSLVNDLVTRNDNELDTTKVSSLIEEQLYGLILPYVITER